jgi:hypothetical protein
LQPAEPQHVATLAVIQYRDGAWRDSLTSLERLKTLTGEYDAEDWFLIAMNRQQLKQYREAKEALREGSNWIEATRRKAEEDPTLRFRFEMMRRSIEALRREAEQLIEGKDRAGESVG